MKQQESGRSLVEIIGVLAISAIMIASAYGIYRSVENRQNRLIASETLKDIAKKTKTLYEFSGYERVSIDQLKEDGVLSNVNPPIGDSWDIKGIKYNSENYTMFVITLKNLSYDDCKYFIIKKSDWAVSVTVGTIDTGQSTDKECEQNSSNHVNFYVK